MRKRNLIILITSITLFLIGVPGVFLTTYQIRLHNPKVLGGLPKVLSFNNGTTVDSVSEWNIRRDEIKIVLEEYEYGHMPGRPDAVQVHLISTSPLLQDCYLENYTITVIPSNATPEVNFNFSLWLYVPSGTGPFPAIVKVSPDGTGNQVPIAQTVVDRGFIFACFEHTDLDPDISGEDVIGPAQESYPEQDWGSLAIWAWGAMHVADFLIQEPWVQSDSPFPSVNESQLIVTGHSRRGKTALVAGAFDERFAMVVPNDSGTGGASSFMIQGFFSERIRGLTTNRRYSYWFQEDFGQFTGKEETLPFDQHFLRALVAPRLLLVTDALGDYWANPPGNQAMFLACQPVFDLLGVSDNNAQHFRKGGHGFLEEDFEVIFGFADKMFFDQSVSIDFYNLPFQFELGDLY
ncbi:MAG: alpha/beta hydrolase family protein [Promethearchaeota archaeon]